MGYGGTILIPHSPNGEAKASAGLWSQGKKKKKKVTD
jgi:hypothetical protein